MSSFRDLTKSLWAELPEQTLARWAALAFSFSVFTLEVSLAASQLFLAFAFLAYLVHLLHDRPSVQFLPVKLPLALFWLLTVAAVLGSTSRAVGWLAARKLVLFCIWLLAANLITRTRHLLLLLQALFLESALAGVVAAGQFFAQYHRVRASHPDRVYFYMTAERIHGFMGHWMNFGGQQMLVFALVLGWLLLGKDRENVSGLPAQAGGAATARTKKIWWVVFVVVVISIGLNLTRGVWLGCFAAGVYLVARWKARWLWLPAGLPLAALLVAPVLMRQRVRILLHPAQDPALSIRFEMWEVGLRMMRKHPWLGVGPNQVPMVYPLYLPPGKAPEIGYHDHLHNNLLQLGAERGLPCLAAWLWLMAALGWQIWRQRRRLGRHGWVAEAALAAWLAFLIEGAFEYNFGASPVLMVFLLVTAMPFTKSETDLT